MGCKLCEHFARMEDPLCIKLLYFLGSSFPDSPWFQSCSPRLQASSRGCQAQGPVHGFLYQAVWKRLGLYGGSRPTKEEGTASSQEWNPQWFKGSISYCPAHCVESSKSCKICLLHATWVSDLAVAGVTRIQWAEASCVFEITLFGTGHW